MGKVLRLPICISAKNRESFPQQNFWHYTVLCHFVNSHTHGVVTVIHEILCLICVSEFFFTVRRIPATVLIGNAVFFIGLASALNIDVLVNQVIA